MRIPINLASEPFSRNRSALAAAVVLSAILIATAALQGYLILAERERAAENRDMVASLSRQLATISAEQSKIDTTMREPVNAAMLGQSVLLNTLIERKSISWTRLFADIEGVLPNNVRLVQIRLPQVNSRNEVTLDMEIGAKQSSDAIDFFSRLEKSPKFGPVTPLRADPPSDSEPLYRYRITVSYGQK
jgi:Tfp pilus assembly protein PilN